MSGPDSKSSLIELFEENGIQFQTSHKDVRQGWIGVQCPWCGSPGEYYLGINIEYAFCNCWRCGPHSLASALAEILNISMGAAIHKARSLPVSFARTERRASDGVYRPPRDLGQLGAIHREYLRSRRFKPKQLARVWGIQGVGPRSLWAWRLFIPVTEHGKPVSWTTRSVNPDEDHSSRYMASPPERERVPIRDLLYGKDFCRHSCLVVEGPADVWRVGPGSVAIIGSGASPLQLEAIAGYAVRAIVFDHEKEAQKRAKKLCDALSVFPGETYRVDLDAADPGEASDKEIRKLRKAFLE